LHFLPINYKGKHANGRGQEVQEEKGAGGAGMRAVGGGGGREFLG